MTRIFIDSSVLFAAAYSSQGHSRDLIQLGVQGKIQLVISSIVMEETRRNLAAFAPDTLQALERIFSTVAFEIVNPSKELVIEACSVVVLKDAPILAAAKAAGVDILVTLDQKHLLDHPELECFIEARILRPKHAYELIQQSSQ